MQSRLPMKFSWYSSLAKCSKFWKWFDIIFVKRLAAYLFTDGSGCSRPFLIIWMMAMNICYSDCESFFWKLNCYNIKSKHLNELVTCFDESDQKACTSFWLIIFCRDDAVFLSSGVILDNFVFCSSMICWPLLVCLWSRLYYFSVDIFSTVFSVYPSDSVAIFTVSLAVIVYFDSNGIDFSFLLGFI